ncbi:MAG: hypothetical protein ABSG53_01790 [Thermoguttaceae bacterium]
MSSASNNGQGQLENLLPQHAELLRKSGITEAVQRGRGYRSVENAEELERLGFGRQQRQVPTLVIPMYNLDGKVVSYQARPDQARTLGGKIAAYENAKGQHYVIDVPPLARTGVIDRQQRLFITIGVRKADSLVSRGESAIALLGPTGWKDQDGFWNRVPLENRPVVVLLDSNATTDRAAVSAATGLRGFLENQKAVVRIIVLPNDATSGKVGVDDFLAGGKTVNDLLALPSFEPSDQSKKGKGEPAYRLMPDGLYRVVGKKEEDLQRLTNFPAKIVKELIVTDGVDETREFEIEAKVAGETKLVNVTAAEFEPLSWVAKKLGADAVVFPGYGIREHVRVAIQQLSGEIPKVMVYTHTGWVHHILQWVFLHAGGAIGAECEIGHAAGDPIDGAADHDDDGVRESAGRVEASRRDDLQVTWACEAEDRPIPHPLADKDLRIGGTIGTIGKQDRQPLGIRVRLPAVLQGFRLPPPPAGDTLIKAVRASLDFLNTAPDRISIPLHAAIWRAVLGNVNHTLQLVGQTQVGKTVLAALVQQHFGSSMDADNLPAAWFSTGIAILATAFLAKDVVLVVDDFVPAGSRSDTDQAQRKAELVLRAQGNRAGRARCRGDGSLVEGKAPRCSPLSTGEDVPDGQSLNSRGLVLLVGSGDVEWDQVTTCQGHAASGLFAMAMAGFLQWLRCVDRCCRSTS